MDSKKSEKKLTEQCPKCSKPMVNKDGTYCWCWEKQISPLRNRRKDVPTSVGEAIEQYPSPEAISPLTLQGKVNWRTLLQDSGLEPFEVELVIAKNLLGLTMNQIVKVQHWTSLGSANYHYRNSLKKLRKRGFSFE